MLIAVDVALDSLAIADVIIEETDDMRRRRIEEEAVMAKKAKSQKKKVCIQKRLLAYTNMHELQSFHVTKY